MNEDNKPLETDSEEEFNEDDSLEEDLLNDSDEGQQDVDSAKTIDSLTLEELNEKAGRQGDNAFKSKDDFFKHYENLKSFVGKKEVNNSEKEIPDDLLKEVNSLKENLIERDFVSEIPEAKDHLDLVKAVSKDKNIPLKEAWEKHLKEIAEGYSAKKKELEIGIKSKNRLNPMQSPKVKQLAEQAKNGSTAAQEALVREMLGKK